MAYALQTHAVKRPKGVLGSKPRSGMDPPPPQHAHIQCSGYIDRL